MRRRCEALLLAWGALGASFGFAACASGPELAPSTAQSQSIGAGVARINREVQAVRPLVHSGWANEYLDASARLAAIAPRKLGAESVDEVGYYYGDGDSPAFFARLLELFSDGETRHLIGRRFLEVNYGAIGPLRILANAGVLAVGVSPSQRLRALYALPGDQGDVPLYGRAELGRLTLVSGDFPADPATQSQVGGGYDAVVVKNLLKRGRIHPSDSVPAGSQIRLGLSDELYLDALLKLLRPGGRLLVYNLCPAPAAPGQPYNPDADCRNPFPQASWQGAGFRVRDYDRNDTPTAREFGQALGFPTEVFATYTLVEKP